MGDKKVASTGVMLGDKKVASLVFQMVYKKDKLMVVLTAVAKALKSGTWKVALMEIPTAASKGYPRAG